MLEISKDMFKEMCNLNLITFKNPRNHEYGTNYGKTKRKRQIENSVYERYLDFIKNNRVVNRKVFKELIDLEYVVKDIKSNDVLDYKFVVELGDKLNKKTIIELFVNKLNNISYGFIEDCNNRNIVSCKVLKNPLGGKVIINNGLWMYIPNYIIANKNIYVSKSIYEEYIKYL